MAITNVAVAPLILKNVSLVFGPTATGSEFSKHVDLVTFEPSSSSVTWTGMGGNTHTDVSTATWTCTLKYAQDWTTTGSLSAYLFNNEGQTVDVAFKPQTASGPSFTAKVVITPGAIGGDVNAYATASVTLGVTGKPVLVPGV